MTWRRPDRFALRAATLTALLFLAACATTPPPPPPARPYHPRPSPATPAQPPSRPERPPGLSLALPDLPGWADEDHAAAFDAYQRTCGVARAGDLAAVCRRARGLGRLDERRARDFFEANFRAEPIGDSGLLTAYFAPEYEARLSPRGAFSAPVRPKPADLVVLDLGAFDPTLAGKHISGRISAGQFTPYPDRAAIELTQPDEALAWMRPEDLFFLQIQGSGVLRLPDGRRLKVSYAAANGRPFVGIATVLRDRGALAAGDTSGEAIRAWLSDHHGAQADEVMRHDPRYVFFKLSADDGVEPIGAAGAPLVAGRSLAMDPSRHAFGGLYWIDATAPSLNGAFPSYRRLAMALDTGGAIKGEVRADLYVGQGAAAGAEAGRVRHALSLYALVPTDPYSP